jgi:hypothetical protein
MLDPGLVAKRGSYSITCELKDSVTNKSITSTTITFTADRPINIKGTTTDSSGSSERYAR